MNGLSEFASAIISATNPWQTFIDGLNSAIPGLGSVVDFVSSNFVPILAFLGTFITGIIIPALTKWAIQAWATAAANYAALAPILIPVLAIAAAVGLLVAAWQNNWFGIRDATAAAWAYLQPILQQLWQWLQVNVPLAIAAAVAAFWAIVAGAQQAGTAISTWFGQAVVWRQKKTARPSGEAVLYSREQISEIDS